MAALAIDFYHTHKTDHHPPAGPAQGATLIQLTLISAIPQIIISLNGKHPGISLQTPRLDKETALQGNRIGFPHLHKSPFN